MLILPTDTPCRANDGDSLGVGVELKMPAKDCVQMLTTTDGSTNLGKIVRIGVDDVDFETDFGVILVPLSRIKMIREIPEAQIRQGEVWFPNPNATRLFFAPTARMLKKGQGYFSDYYLFFPGFTYGLSDYVTLGGGVSIFPGIGMENQLYYLTPKVGVSRSASTNLAVGALIVRIPSDDDLDNPFAVGIVYGVSTLGGQDGSFTVGLGYGFEGGNLADRPMIMIGGEKRLSRRTAFVTENWMMPGVDNPLISYGIRFFGEKISVDLGLLNTVGDEAIFPGVPYIDFVVQF
jgi:hypothetical protein